MSFSFRLARISLLFIHSSYDIYLMGRNESYGHQGWKMNQLTFPGVIGFRLTLEYGKMTPTGSPEILG